MTEDTTMQGWLTGLPQEAGWYWVRSATGAESVVQVVQTAADGMTVRPGLRVVNYTLSGGENWYGPLDAPVFEDPAP
jgi:hypothetical protein